MTREQAILICETFGVDINDTDEIDMVVDAVATINYGDGYPTPEQLNELRQALEVLRTQ